ncbi:MAG: TatD family hydrolase [Candidatus Geothermincolia bacterium]
MNGAGLIDTHAHLDLIDASCEQIVRKAGAAGVACIIDVGIDLESCRKAVAMAQASPQVYAAIGIHPHDASSIDDAVLGQLRELAAHPKVVAIGETGLDFYRNRSPRDAQERGFRLQIELACELGLALVVHDREAHARTLELLSEASLPPGRVVLHCFSGDAHMAEACLELGCHISLAGPLTFSNARSLREVTAALPLERLLLETDSPFLSPHPHRGKPNSPARLPLIAAALADVLGVTPEEVASATTANARRVFNLPSL